MFSFEVAYDLLNQQHLVLTTFKGLAVAWSIIRFGSIFIDNPLVSRTVASIIWVIAALKILGYLPQTVAYLDKITLGTEKDSLSLYDIVSSTLSVGAMIWGAMLFSSVLERVIVNNRHISGSAQALFMKIAKFILITVAFLFGLKVVGISLTTFAVFGGAMGVGIGLGLWIGLSEKFDWLFSPIFIVMQSAPLAALIPLLVMAYGIGLTSKVFVVCIMAMPVIVLNTSGAVRNTPTAFKEMARSFLGTERDIILKVIIPAASPIIFSGLRLGISAGFIGAILSELKITPTGVGDIITYSRSIADYPSMYAAIFSIILLAVLFLNVLEKLENYLFEGNNRGCASD